MKRSYTYTSKKNLCPVCGNHHGCLINQDLSVLCLRVDNQKDAPEGYRFAKPLSGGMGGLFVTTDNNKTWVQGQQRQNGRRLALAAKEGSRQKSGALSVAERDRLYCQMLSQLTLNPTDRADLHRRGVTDEQIRLWNVKSVERWQKLDSCLSPSLPGVSLSGLSLVNYHPGYLVPIQSPSGEITGFQIANRERSEGRPKYPWLTGKTSKRPEGAQPNLLNGELPITVAYPSAPDTDEAVRIGLCEGTGVKPRLAAERLGIPVVGASGGHFVSSPKTLESYIKEISEIWISQKKSRQQSDAWNSTKTATDKLPCQDTGESRSKVNGDGLDTNSLDGQGRRETDTFGLSNATCILLPDAGAVINSHIMSQYKNTIGLLSRWGYSVQVAWWGQVTKDDCDIDELDSFDCIKYLTPAEFFDLSRTELYKKQVREAQRKLNRLSYPAITVNQRYLDVELSCTGISLVKSPMGTGKTEAIKKLRTECKVNDKRLLLLGSRNGLLYQTCGRAGIDHLRSLQAVGFSPLTSTMLRNAEALAMCVDSLWRLNPDEWQGATVVIDEAESVVDHLLMGNTCAKRRAELCTKLADIVQAVIRSGGRVVLMDAGLTDVPVSYIKQLAPEETPVSGVINTWKSGDGWNVKFHDGTTDGVKDFVNDDSAIAQEIIACLQSGGIPVVATDSQMAAEALERRLAQVGFINGLRVDSTTSEESADVQRFLESPNQYLRDKRPQWLIYTPTAESGLSIDENHFTLMFGLFKGVVGTKTQMQMLGRVRSPIPRHVFSALYGLKDEDWARHLPQEIEERMMQYHDANNLLIQIAGRLIESDDPTDAQRLAAFNRLHDPATGGWNSPHIKTWAQLKARTNYQKANLRSELKKALTDAGHQVRVVTEFREDKLKEELAGLKDEIKQERAEAIANAEDISLEQARTILQTDSSTRTDRDKAQKAILGDSLPGVELTPEFVLKSHIEKNGEWLKRIRLDWMLRHPEVQKKLDCQNWAWHLDQPFVSLQDVKAYSLKLKALKSLGVLDLLDPDRVFSANCPETQAFIKSARNHSKRNYLKALNLSLNAKSDPIIFIRHLLEKVGAKITCADKRTDSKGAVIRYYKVDKNYWEDADKQAVIAAFDAKFGASSHPLHDGGVKPRQNSAGHGLQLRHLEAVGVYILSSPSVQENSTVSATIETSKNVLQAPTNNTKLEGNEVDCCIETTAGVRVDQATGNPYRIGSQVRIWHAERRTWVEGKVKRVGTNKGTGNSGEVIAWEVFLPRWEEVYRVYSPRELRLVVSRDEGENAEAA